MSLDSRGDHHDQMTLTILRLLEEAGLDQESYRLYDYFDPDALERLVASLDGDFSISISIQDVTLEVTEGEVRVA